VNPLVRRQSAVKATMERFRGRAFSFGSVDCAKLTAFHLRQMGHRVSLAKAGRYRTVKSAQAALRRLGFETLPDAMDGHGFVRIPWAAALIGDVVTFASDHPIGALGIVAGNGNMLAFHELHDLPVIMTMGRIDACWRVPVR
jgi:hypothetical protein